MTRVIYFLAIIGLCLTTVNAKASYVCCANRSDYDQSVCYAQSTPWTFEWQAREAALVKCGSPYYCFIAWCSENGSYSLGKSGGQSSVSQEGKKKQSGSATVVDVPSSSSPNSNDGEIVR